MKKRCNRCHQMKPLSEFGRDRNQQDERARRCRDCHNHMGRIATAKIRARYAALGMTSRGGGRINKPAFQANPFGMKADVMPDWDKAEAKWRQAWTMARSANR